MGMYEEFQKYDLEDLHDPDCQKDPKKKLGYHARKGAERLIGLVIFLVILFGIWMIGGLLMWVIFR